MTRLRRYWWLVTGTAGAGWYVFSRYRQRLQSLHAVILPANNGMEIPEAINRRLKQYIPPFLLIEYLYVQLWQQPMPSLMLRQAILLNGLTPVFDDLIDDSGMTVAEIRHAIIGPDEPTDFTARICRSLFVQTGSVWDASWDAIFWAQSESRQQKEGTLSRSALRDITTQKGAASVLLGWKVITAEKGGAAMQQLSHDFGAFSQILNDIFDICKDHVAGIQMLATSCTDIRQLQAEYREYVAALGAALEQLEAPAGAKGKVAALLTLLIGLGELALERLLKLQVDHGGVFETAQFSRKELVCDMALWENRFRWGYYCLTIIFPGRKTLFG